MSPLQIRMAIAYYCSSSPELMFAKDQWESDAAIDARAWLQENALIEWQSNEGRYLGTEKLKVYITKLCSIPVPVAITVWEFREA